MLFISTGKCSSCRQTTVLSVLILIINLNNIAANILYPITCNAVLAVIGGKKYEQMQLQKAYVFNCLRHTICIVSVNTKIPII